MRRQWMAAGAAFMVASCVCGGPQHWGFGFGYLVTVEENQAGRRCLSVYEPPLRVKDGDWLLRWRDDSGSVADVMADGLAVGDFWPRDIGTEYAVAVVADGGDVRAMVLKAPEVFGTEPWVVLSRHALPGMEGAAARLAPGQIRIAAGDLSGTGRDQLVVAHTMPGAGNVPVLTVYDPAGTPESPQWSAREAEFVRLDDTPGPLTGMLADDFWGDGRQRLALAFAVETGTEVRYWDATRAGDRLQFEEVARETVRTAEPGPLACAAADFLKDGLAYVIWMPRDPSSPTLHVRVAPRADARYRTVWVRPEETFAGANLPGQQQGEGRQIMTGRRQAPFGRIVAAAGGRVFGYVIPGCDERKNTFWSAWTFQGADDVEISFADRVPVYRLGVPKRWQDGGWPWEPDDHYGWPHKEEMVTYRVHVKNNGTRTIPAGVITLQSWVNVADRNADTLPDAEQRVGFVHTLEEPLPPFDPDAPRYAVVEVPFRWPYALEQPEGWTWKRINVREVGERWFITRLQYAGDENERNNRYEMALNAAMLRPVYKYDDEVNTLEWRAPTVLGDPESKEYITRKLADSVQCMWERSRTSGGDDVLQRIAFVGYRLGEGTTSRRDLDWSFYEGPRDLQKWIGLWGDFERFNPWDGGAELHESGHLFHRIGDLYHYYVFPTGTRKIVMGDGAPVQMYTYAWGRDSFCDGQAIIGEGAADLHRFIEGVRYGLGWPWHRMLPAKVFVRVLDRKGEPVAGARVTFWTYTPTECRRVRSGRTGVDGRWDTGLPGGTSTLFDPLGIPLYDDPECDALAHVYTVDFDGYSEFGILGADDVTSHSRYTLMARSVTHPQEWTWDLPTLYEDGAPLPEFDVAGGVRGRAIKLEVRGEPGRRFRLYRRWEPTYRFERIDEQLATDGRAVFTDDMGAEDWFGSNRYRAVYYVTQVGEGIESLPRRVYGMGIEKAHGITDMGEGRLLVTVNCGKAEPFAILAQGTTPEVEYIKHYRFGHTAAKIVPSAKGEGRFYATLAASDLPGAERAFDLIQFGRPDRFEAHYPVLQTIWAADVVATPDQAPSAVTFAAPDPDARAPVQIGDVAINAHDTNRRARIVDVLDDGLVLAAPIFEPDRDGQRVHIEFAAGTPGSGTEDRSLLRPRGLATVEVDGREYILIADHGNGRVVLWSDATRFLDVWTTQGMRPAAVAADPRGDGHAYVLDRRPDRRSLIHRLRVRDGRFVGTAEEGIPVNVGDATSGPEMGLAVATDPTDGRTLIAVTDAERRRVMEFKEADGAWREVACHTAACGTFAGPGDLEGPSDVAYSRVGGELQLFAVDGRQRVVRLR